MSKISIGDRFGKLSVIKEPEFKRSRQWMWLCKCDCGKEKFVAAGNLNAGCVRSCGCIVGKNNTKHGDWNKRIRIVWINMMRRCYKEQDVQYHTYGGRGISVCEEWNDYTKFKAWAYSNGYTDKLTLDRYPNMNGNYEPGNCRWADYFQQANNRRSNTLLEFMGKTKTIAEWAKEYGKSQIIVRDRVFDLGWSVEDALKKPIDISRRNKNCKNVD